MAIIILDIKDGQKIKALDDLYQLDARGEDDMIETDNFVIQLTGNQIKSNLIVVAKAGDVGIYSKSKESIIFTNEDGTQKESYDFLFLEFNDSRELNEALFQLVD